VACVGQDRKLYKDMVGKLEGKRPLVRARRRWKDNISISLKKNMSLECTLDLSS